jgi:hypothetical protein
MERVITGIEPGERHDLEVNQVGSRSWTSERYMPLVK